MSSIVYRSDLAEVILGDAHDALTKIATESVDLIVTDPPYGAEWRSDRRAERFDALSHGEVVPDDRRLVRRSLTRRLGRRCSDARP